MESASEVVERPAPPKIVKATRDEKPEQDASAEKPTDAEDGRAGAEVVSLDAFRKK
jgi:hypothetical protein